MKQKLQKPLVLFLSVFLFFSGCGTNAASSSPNDESGSSTLQTEPLSSFTLAVAKNDGTNPYLSQNTLTFQNAPLLYGQLVTIDPSFQLQMGLAASVSVSGTAVVIQMGSGSFADGTSVTAADAAASLSAAKQSAVYAGRFANVTAISVQGNSVAVTLAEPDALFAYLLDIPVLKAAETAASFPMGSGRYTPAKDENGNRIFQKNPFYTGTVPIDTIQLLELSGQDALASSLSIGDLSFYSSDLAQDNGSIACSTEYFKTNELVFLGVNNTRGALQNAAVRKAISAGVDRTTLCEKGYFSRAYPATGALNASYPILGGKQYLGTGQDQSGALSALSAAGYTISQLDGFATDAAGQRLTLKMLVYTPGVGKRYTASLIKEQLASVGIEVQIEEMDSFTDYSARIAKGDFDLYIGEVKLYNNMDQNVFLKGGAASVGVSPSEGLLSAYAAFRQSTDGAEAFETAFSAELPYIPLLYRRGTVSYARTITGVQPSLSDVFYQFEQFKTIKE